VERDSRHDVGVPVERCSQCGFDSDVWSDAAAIEAIGRLPGQWVAATAGLDVEALARRPITGMWSIGEYTDHVREVLFGMQFVLDSATTDPGVDLGEAPRSEFTLEPRPVDVTLTLKGIDREARALVDSLMAMPSPLWNATATIGGIAVDAHWIARHAVHDATHHLDDVTRLSAAL
jgi:hypothetical protein